MPERPVKPSRSVLVVDDSEDDVLLLSMTLEHAQLPWNILAALSDGEQAINWLQRNYLVQSLPMHKVDLLLIDLKMPRRDGFDVLKWMQDNLRGHCFTTVVFSSSFVVADITRARELGADFYFTKPVLSDDRKKILVNLEHMLASTAPVTQHTARHFDAMLAAVRQPQL